ncbi:MBL fold metallo-hydrolase [Phenylobacterium sp. J367]|uniref:MBL fold metallo-hydrolase n=1 Tax=Phenylobacterium sp. J367 TaxID=2898435 RepID=UPI0027E244E5|nr:MBL fold metallo-hydrolase [Phenylobacterium sp. J367]
MTVQLTFHGAAGCVTGFCARLQTPRATMLIDCGMFQGSKTLKALNYEPFPFKARDVDAVLLTHAHIDHSGLLPKLMRAGFEGPVLATSGTRDLCAVMLPDAGDIQESEVRQLNRRNERRGRPLVEPIYTARDGADAVELFRTVRLGREVDVAPGVQAVFWEAGHILGSTSVEVRVATEEGPLTLLFSGDLGPGGRDYAPDPKGPAGVDHLILESTYGARERPALDPRRPPPAARPGAERRAGGRRPADHPRLRRGALAGAAGRRDDAHARRRHPAGRHLPGLAPGHRGDRGVPAARLAAGSRPQSLRGPPPGRPSGSSCASRGRATSWTASAAGGSSWRRAACATPAASASTSSGTCGTAAPPC